MWVFRYARFVRAEQFGKDWPKWLRSLIRLLLIPVQVAQFVVFVFVLVAVAFVPLRLFWTAGCLWHAFRKALISDNARSRQIQGGEVRQTGFLQTISKARHGESARGGDLRRRLNELRSMRTGNPAHRPQHLGGQYGRQKK
jgi:hypothetical protein